MPRGNATDQTFTRIIHAEFTAEQEHELRVFAQTEELIIDLYRAGIG